MRIIIDSNRIIAALIRGSASRQVIIKSAIEFVAPDMVLREIYDHLPLISRKNGLSEEDNMMVLAALLDYVQTASLRIYGDRIEDAKKLIGKHDMNDVPLAALALSIENDGIWTEDEHFGRQKAIKIWNTEELLKVVVKWGLDRPLGKSGLQDRVQP